MYNLRHEESFIQNIFHYFTFNSGPYRYDIHRHILAEDSQADATLILFQGQQEVLRESGHIIEP